MISSPDRPFSPTAAATIERQEPGHDERRKLPSLVEASPDSSAIASLEGEGLSSLTPQGRKLLVSSDGRPATSLNSSVEADREKLAKQAFLLCTRDRGIGTAKSFSTTLKRVTLDPAAATILYQRRCNLPSASPCHVSVWDVSESKKRAEQARHDSEAAKAWRL